MNISQRTIDYIIIVEVTGEEDLDTAPELHAAIVDANRPVIRPIEISGLDQVLRLYHTVDEALRSRR